MATMGKQLKTAASKVTKATKKVVRKAGKALEPITTAFGGGKTTRGSSRSKKSGARTAAKKSSAGRSSARKSSGKKAGGRKAASRA